MVLTFAHSKPPSAVRYSLGTQILQDGLHFWPLEATKCCKVFHYINILKDGIMILKVFNCYDYSYPRDRKDKFEHLWIKSTKTIYLLYL